MRERKRGRAVGAAAAALLLASGLVPARALAGTDRPDPAPVPSATEVPYVARWWDGSQVVSEARSTRDYWYVRGSEEQFNGPEAGGGGWHYAGASVRFVDRVSVNGTVDLVLKDGVTLTFEDGLHVPPGSTLNVYGQGGGSGTLKALGDTNYVAAIGGNEGEAGGTVNVYGGNVVADAYNSNKGEDAAGIGGGNHGSGGSFAIYGGRVEATGANYGAGIGGGDADGEGKSGGTVRVYGGEVVAKGGTDSAGIGGGEGCGGADFEMWGGTVRATGGSSNLDGGAGIGSGDKDGRSITAGSARIHGGTVVAQGGPDGAGVGGGNEVRAGSVTIDGGTVQATGGADASGIGGGQGGSGGTVEILGGDVTAQGGKCGAGIGGGDHGAGGEVTIEAGTVTATGGHSDWGNGGAGIGGGNEGAGGKVTVTGGDVTATGGKDASGIGGGDSGAGGTITIQSGTVNATGGNYGAGVGGGFNGPGGTIRIDGGDVTATGGDGGAGIGGGNNTNNTGDGSGGNITITGGTVIAIGGGDDNDLDKGGAGIGGGDRGAGGTITIADADVTAKGAQCAAGIGGGDRGASGNVTIDSGTVRASCEGISGAGIGSGAMCDKLDSVNVTINGGLVEATGGRGYEIGEHSYYPGAAIGAGGYDLYHNNVDNDSLFDGDIRLNGGRITARAGEAASDAVKDEDRQFEKDSNYCNAIGTTDESGLEDAAGTVHFGGAVVHIEPQKDLGGAWSQAVRATSVTFGRKAMDVLYRTDEGGELSLAAEAERAGVLTSAGKQYVQVSPSEEADAGGGEVLPAPDGPLAVSGLGHVQGVGDVAGTPTADGGVLLGTTGQARRLEAISVSLPEGSGCYVEYRSHLQGRGWETDWASNGAPSGTFGEARRVEAVQMRLSGGAAEAYSVWYRVHSQSFGWLGWAHDGQAAGTAGQAKRAEAVEVRVLPIGQLPEGYVDGQASYVGAATGSAHVQGTGWTAKGDSLVFGTTGEARRLEALRLELANQPLPGGIDYAAYVQGVGWMGATDGEVAGTTGESRRVETVKARLTGEMAAGYSVWYRVHSQSYGWLGWAHDGDEAGTTGLAKRAEAVEVQVLPAGQLPAGYDPGVAACVVGL